MGALGHRQRLAGFPPCSMPRFVRHDPDTFAASPSRWVDRKNLSCDLSRSFGTEGWHRIVLAVRRCRMPGKGRLQAAFVAGRVAAAVDSNRTETRFETPDSSIVTPYSVVAAAIVFLEWVTTMNCVVERKSRSTPT